MGERKARERAAAAAEQMKSVVEIRLSAPLFPGFEHPSQGNMAGHGQARQEYAKHGDLLGSSRVVYGVEGKGRE